MPMRSDRMRRGRIRRRRSELDWFAEDPWAEPNPPAAWKGKQDKLDFESLGWSDDDEYHEDDYDGWGPIRSRRRPVRDA